MKKSILAALLGLAIIISCEQKHSTTETEDHADHTGHVVTDIGTQASDDDHADTSATLELDNGKKWTTNPEMLPYINEQKQLIDKFDSDQGDYKKLATNLDAANQNLIKSCTMKGKSHDVLHVWLTAHMKNIDELGKATTPQEAERIVDQLEDSMEAYNKYFS